MSSFLVEKIGFGLQPERDFSVPASTSRRGFGGRPPRRSTLPVTMSTAPAAKLAWMLIGPLTISSGPAIRSWLTGHQGGLGMLLVVRVKILLNDRWIPVDKGP